MSSGATDSEKPLHTGHWRSPYSITLHLRLRIAEDGAVLGDPLKLLLDEADVLEVGVASRPAARLADDDQDSDRADGEEGDAARDLPGACAVHVATARRRERASGCAMSSAPT